MLIFVSPSHFRLFSPHSFPSHLFSSLPFLLPFCVRLFHFLLTFNPLPYPSLLFLPFLNNTLKSSSPQGCVMVTREEVLIAVHMSLASESVGQATGQSSQGALRAVPTAV